MLRQGRVLEHRSLRSPSLLPSPPARNALACLHLKTTGHIVCLPGHRCVHGQGRQACDRVPHRELGRRDSTDSTLGLEQRKVIAMKGSEAEALTWEVFVTPGIPIVTPDR